MNDKNQPDIYNSIQKLPFYKTPEGKAYMKAYRQSQEWKAKQKDKRQTPEAKAKKKEYDKARRQTPEYKAKQDVYQKDYQHNPKAKAYRKAYRQTPEYKAKRQTPEYKAAQKAWREANREKKLAANKASHEKRLKRDPLYASKCILRSAVWHAFNRIGQNKPADTQTLLGCDSETAKAHFEALFKEGMTWENHGEWHVDHIRPVSSFKEDELHLMNHITNLQPLWADENWEKSDKIL